MGWNACDANGVGTVKHGRFSKTVQRVGIKRSRTQPFVMRLVNALVQERGMQQSMNPVDAIIGEQQISKEIDLSARATR